MTIQERIEKFLNDTESISNNPNSRLSAKVKEVLNRNNYVFDSHCHIFDGACVDAKYFILRMLAGFNPFSRRVIMGIIFPKKDKLFKNTKRFNFDNLIYEKEGFNDGFENLSDDKFLDQIDKQIVLFMSKNKSLKLKNKQLDKNLNKIRDIIAILRTAKMKNVYESFVSKYSINRLFEPKKEIISVVAGMDLNEGWGGSRIKKSQHKQNQELLEMAANEPILPFFPIDPRRAEHTDKKENLYENFIEAFKNPNRSFFGVKVYPALGYHPNDYRLAPIFKVCAEKKIPVMTHCGGTIVSTFEKPVWVLDGKEKIKVKKLTRKKRAEWLNDPVRWDKVLKTNKSLHLNLAHFGGSDSWSSKKPKKTERRKNVLSYMKKYDGVYADFSFNLESNVATNVFVSKLKKDIVMQKKSMFGTDYWVILPKTNLNRQQQLFINKTGDQFNKLAIDNVKAYLYM